MAAMTPRAWTGALAAAAILAAGQAAPGRTGQDPQTFRSRTTLVPVDVRVLDAQGRPVTDLAAADFRILEDGAPQVIQHVSLQALEPGAPAAPAAADPGLARRHRVFLIVLGRGRLQPPARGFDGAIAFVRDRLLPDDRVAVLAWNRATEFTTDHARIVRLLERVRERHEAVEARLSHWYGDLTLLFNDRQVPAHAQPEIDEIFRGPEGAFFREPPPGRMTDPGGLDRETWRAIDGLVTGGAAPDRALSFLGPYGRQDYLWRDRHFREHVVRTAASMQDLENLFRGVDYVRFLDGEKHVVLLTERGLYLPRSESERRLAELAADARVTINTILTGGVAHVPILPPAEPSFHDLFAVSAIKGLAADTGGQTSVNLYADAAFARIDEASRTQYVLGYTPSNLAWDGRFRRIRVEVDRPGVTVAFRRGYYGWDRLLPVDPVRFQSYSRIAAAGGRAGDVADIGLTASVAAGATEVVVDVRIDPARVAFTTRAGVREATVELAVFCGDASETIVGEAWQQVAIRLDAAAFDAARAGGVPVQVRVPVRAQPRFVKVVAYDAESDLAGTATVRLASK